MKVVFVSGVDCYFPVTVCSLMQKVKVLSTSACQTVPFRSSSTTASAAGCSPRNGAVTKRWPSPLTPPCMPCALCHPRRSWWWAVDIPWSSSAPAHSWWRGGSASPRTSRPLSETRSARCKPWREMKTLCGAPSRTPRWLWSSRCPPGRFQERIAWKRTWRCSSWRWSWERCWARWGSANSAVGCPPLCSVPEGQKALRVRQKKDGTRGTRRRNPCQSHRLRRPDFWNQSLSVLHLTTSLHMERVYISRGMKSWMSLPECRCVVNCYQLVHRVVTAMETRVARTPWETLIRQNWKHCVNHLQGRTQPLGQWWKEVAAPLPPASGLPAVKMFWVQQRNLQHCHLSGLCQCAPQTLKQVRPIWTKQNLWLCPICPREGEPLPHHHPRQFLSADAACCQNMTVFMCSRCC